MTVEELNAKYGRPASAVGKSISFADRWATPKKRTGLEKVADFTGGKELGQGLGQAMALGKNSKAIDETQKEQIDIQTKLIKRIREKKDLGQDTSRLEGALEDLGMDIESRGNNAENILNPNQLTEKQIIGDALQIGTTVLGAGTLPGATKAVTGATTIGKGMAQGFKTGAITGGAISGATGFSQGLQEDKSVKDSLVQGLKTGAVGAVTGGVLGLATGGISGGIRGRALRKEQALLKNVTPDVRDIPAKQYEKLLAQGKISPKTATGRAKYVLSDAEKQTALKYQKLVKKDPVETTKNIINEISRQDDEVGVFLRKKNGIFNTGELKNSIKTSMSDVTDIMADEKKINKAKTALIDNFIKELPKNDMESLWKARKAFDGKIDSAFKGSPTLQKEMKIAFRNAVQDFISERTDDVTYRAMMKEMSNLFRLKDTVAVKAVKERGMSALRKWAIDNPIKAGIAGGVGTTAVGGAVVSKLVD